MERRSDSDATSARKVSCSPPERMEEQRDHDVSILVFRLEENFSCVSSMASPKIWYIDSEASTHMTGV